MISMTNFRCRYLAMALLGITGLTGLPGCDRSVDGSTPAPGKSSAGGMRISDAHMPEPPPGAAMGAVYLTLDNSGAMDRQLLMIETDVAANAQLHRTSYDDGTMRMRHVPHLTVPAGQTVRFEPGGYHIMLMQMAEKLEAGASFDLKLTFDGGELMMTEVEVRPLR